MERPDEQDSGFEFAAAALVHGGELHSYICVGGPPHKGRSEGKKFSPNIESWDTDTWIYLCNSVLPCTTGPVATSLLFDRHKTLFLQHYSVQGLPF